MTVVFFVPVAIALACVGPEPGLAGTPAASYPTPAVRLVALSIVAAALVLVAWFRPRWEFVRDVLPFVLCATIYANLHDLIRFFGAPDITAELYRWDLVLFGVEPSVWAERFIHPLWTDFFTVCYWLFYFWGPLLGFLLYLRRERQAFRETMVSIVFCLYLGYIGYVAWPASAPRLFIPHAFSITLRGTAALDSSRASAAAIPLTSQGAFPSLHCAIALLALLLGWKHLRWYFWIQLPFAIGLIVGTVYLRHHWVVDILAGFVLTAVAYWAGPKIEHAWERARALPERALPRRETGEPVSEFPRDLDSAERRFTSNQ
jgi:membrane-associated phospholipid phosphatase